MSIGRFRAKLSSEMRAALSENNKVFAIEALCGGEAQKHAKAALEESGKARRRACPLQPRFLLWFGVCLSIFRDDSIPSLLGRLMESLRSRIPEIPRRSVTDGAISHGRRWLGVRPLRLFFRKLTASAGSSPSFHGLRPIAVDGVRLNMPDTEKNRRAFGRPESQRGPSAFSQALVVVLVDALTRIPLDLKVMSYKGSERAAAERLLRSVGSEDLFLLDRGFFGLRMFRAIREREAHFLCRAPASAKLLPIGGKKARSSGDYRAIMRCRVPLGPGEAPPNKRGRPAKTKVVQQEVRVIEYQVPGFRRVRLVTSLLDTEITAEELIALYHQRWEAETAYDEIKTGQFSPAKGTLQADFRSKTPRGVLQEIYGLFASYVLIRQTMAAAAQGSGRTPLELSFTEALRIIVSAIPRMLAARTRYLPRLFAEMLADIAASPVDRPRRRRRYPRVVKRKIGKFPAKRPHHRELPALDPVAAFSANRESSAA